MSNIQRLSLVGWFRNVRVTYPSGLRYIMFCLTVSTVLQVFEFVKGR